MSYNQSFTPQSGQGNLSAQFGGPHYQPSNDGSAPRDIPGRAHRQSSVSSGYGSYPSPQAGYGVTPPGGYGGSPHMAYSPHGGPYATSPSQHMAPPPNQMPAYGASPASHQPGVYGTSPSHLHPMAARAAQNPGWQQPNHGPSSYPPSSYPSMEHRRSSTSSYKGSHHSSDASERKKSKRRPSVPSRYDSPRRPTVTDSVLAAWDGLKGAFDRRN